MGDAGSWTGTVRLRPGVLVFVGKLGSAHAHAHAAVQLLVVSSGRVIVTDESGGERNVATAAISPGVQHAVRAESAFGAAIYLDPASRGTGVSAQDQLAGWESKAALLSSVPLDEEFPETALTLLTSPPATDPNPSLRRAVELVDQGTAGPLRLADVAAQVGLSPSRLRHLFRERLGLPFTAYVRWARLRAAMETVQAGGSLTEAAHLAGFTDSSHLTRVTHAMFGLPPSAAAHGLRWE
ncbi:AraC family transcriptional regulator [Nonomuraea jabiensis]|uniref:helix-turn-helix transcriptional regulator n=1 Tax=Nonomuraea jabiensis TaxID=882448 RepID=UPI003430C06D